MDVHGALVSYSTYQKKSYTYSKNIVNKEYEIEAMKKEEVEEDDDYICPSCSGSGEGMHEGAVCHKCKGTGGYPKQYLYGDDE